MQPGRKSRALDLKTSAVTKSAPDNPAKNVTPSLVRRNDAVRDEHRRRSRVVSDHTKRCVLDGHPSLVPALREGLDPADDSLEEVRVVIVVLALENRRDAFEAGARVDARLRKRGHLSRGAAVELHEDEVPDLHDAVAGAIRRRVAGNSLALVIVDLAARAARPGVAHRPEVVLLAEARDARLREVALPQRGRLVVVREDRRPEARGVEPVAPRDELPRVVDRLLLEVIAEGEVAEHLEERVVSRRVAHVVEVVVLAARPHAFLRRRRARVGSLLAPEKESLNWFMPAFVKSSVGSSAGTSEEDATRVCPFSSKNDRNVSRTLREVQPPEAVSHHVSENTEIS